MSGIENGSFAPMNTIYTGTGTTSSSITYNIYTELAENFDLDLTEDQLSTLNELFNSGDEGSRLVAANMFKYMLFKDKEAKDGDK